jgi:hypothetical protein
LARWIERPFRPQGQDPRAVLLAAMTDFGGSALAARAVAFYDDPRQFEAFLDGLRLEAPWTEHARAPIPAELAFEIFFVLLLENKYLGYIGWDAVQIRYSRPTIGSSQELGSPSSRTLSGKRLDVSASVAGSAAILS